MIGLVSPLSARSIDQQRQLREQIQLGERSVRLLQLCCKTSGSCIKLPVAKNAFQEWPESTPYAQSSQSSMLATSNATDTAIPVLPLIFAKDRPREMIIEASGLASLHQEEPNSIGPWASISSVGSQAEEFHMLMLCLAKLEALKYQVRFLKMASIAPGWLADPGGLCGFSSSMITADLESIYPEYKNVSLKMDI